MKAADADRWTILKHLRENYEVLCKVCGVHSEEAQEAQEAKDIYKKVMSQPLEECQADIESFYSDMYSAVEGEIHTYYASDPEFIRMIEKMILEED